MRALAVTLLVLALAGCASPGRPRAWAEPAPTPGEWIDEELAPEFARRLADHPRFAGEVVAVGLPRGLRTGYSRLEQRLEGLLESRLAHGTGLRLRASTDPECTSPAAAYALGIFVRRVDDEARVELRVVDTRSGEWVTGLADSWQGYLSGRDRADQAAPADLPDQRGSKGRPFAPAETERAAEALAAQLSCALVARRLSPGTIRAGSDPMAGLTAGYLANLGHTRSDREDWALEVRRETGEGGAQRVVATLASDAGRVTAETWIGATRASPAPASSSVPASAGTRPTAAIPPHLEPAPCGDACLGVTVGDPGQAVVLAVIPGRGLSSTRGCPVRIGHAGRAVTTVPAPHARWARFYAVRANGFAAGELERLAARLPSACGAQVLSGEGRWLAELERLAGQAGPAMAWTAVTARSADFEEDLR